MISTWKHRLHILKRISAKKWFAILGASNTKLQPQSLYSIKTGYHHAAYAESFDDTGSNDEWQRSVYEYAVSLERVVFNESCPTTRSTKPGKNDFCSLGVISLHQMLISGYQNRKKPVRSNPR